MAEQTQASNDVQILRIREVNARTGLPRSSVYALIKAGKFTSQIRLGKRAVGWPLHEVNEINLARIAGKSDDDICALVKKLEAARKSLA